MSKPLSQGQFLIRLTLGVALFIISVALALPWMLLGFFHYVEFVHGVLK